MIGWLLVIATASAYELWAELNHATTLTYAIRDLSAWPRAALFALGLALLVHLVVPQSWATRHDPIDNFEHRVHDLTHNR